MHVFTLYFTDVYYVIIEWWQTTVTTRQLTVAVSWIGRKRKSGPTAACETANIVGARMSATAVQRTAFVHICSTVTIHSIIGRIMPQLWHSTCSAECRHWGTTGAKGQPRAWPFSLVWWATMQWNVQLFIPIVDLTPITSHGTAPLWRRRRSWYLNSR